MNPHRVGRSWYRRGSSGLWSCTPKRCGDQKGKLSSALHPSPRVHQHTSINPDTNGAAILTMLKDIAWSRTAGSNRRDDYCTLHLVHQASDLWRTASLLNSRRTTCLITTHRPMARYTVMILLEPVLCMIYAKSSSCTTIHNRMPANALSRPSDPQSSFSFQPRRGPQTSFLPAF